MESQQLLKKDQEQLLVLTDLITVLVDADTNGKQYSIIEDIVPPLAGPPLHTHLDEEIFYVLEGNFEFILNDPASPIPAKVGDVITVPSNALPGLVFEQSQEFVLIDAHTFRSIG